MMTDPKAGIADIKEKTPAPNHSLYEPKKEPPSRFQRNTDVKVEISDYNSGTGKLKL